MFGVNTDSVPSLMNYEGAKRHLCNTKPITRGSNKGLVPLRDNRRDPDTYNIRRVVTSHALDSTPQSAICCRMYDTDIVIFYEDGVVEISDYKSTSTVRIQSELMGWCGLHGNDYSKTLHINHLRIVDSPLYAPFRCRYRGDYRIPFGEGNLFLVPMGDRYSVYGHGYYAGTQRGHHNKTAGAFIRQAQAQLRALYRMRGCDEFSSNEVATLADMFDGKTQRWGTLKTKHMQLFDIISYYDWEKGEHISADMMNEVLTIVPDGNIFRADSIETYNDRLRHWEALRMTIRYADERDYDFSDWRVYSEEKAFELITDIEEVESW